MPPATAQISIDSVVLALTGSNLLGLAVGWARALPVAFIVPAFGMPGIPGTLRAAVALSLSGIALVAAGPATASPGVFDFLSALLDGFGMALPAALGIWIATMAGSLYDELTLATAEPTVDLPLGGRGPTGTLFGFVALIAFLGQGGPARLAEALCRPVEPSRAIGRRMVDLLASGIGLSVTLAAPLVSAAVVMEVSALLVVRQSPTAAARGLVQVLRGFLRLLVLALFLQWILIGIAEITR